MDEQTTKLKCRMMVRSGRNKFPCKNSATRDGFCGIHHPDMVGKRREKSEQRWAAESLVRSERYEREDYNRAAGEFCRRRGMTKEDLIADTQMAQESSS